VNVLEKACALLENADLADLARLCGAERLMLQRQLIRWTRALERSAPTRTQPPVLLLPAPDTRPRSGVLAALHDGERAL
jgi:hypothetical protein